MNTPLVESFMDDVALATEVLARISSTLQRVRQSSKMEQESFIHAMGFEGLLKLDNLRFMSTSAESVVRLTLASAVEVDFN